jgi:DNA repair photolyase
MEARRQAGRTTLRWDNLTLQGTGSGPGGPGTSPAALFERGAVTRTFDTPGFRGITFFEIQARSIINKVPAASRVPFTWTINPYRGCSHACVYCMQGDTPILMADGRTRTIDSLRVGDEIYGTVRRGNYRRFERTRVLAHWRTFKPAYRVTLEDGTELVTSGDHRFLTERGWKYVTGRIGANPDPHTASPGTPREARWPVCHGQSVIQRPYLTTRNKLMGTGRFAAAPTDSADYRRGYVCGMIRGDGSIGTYRYRRSGRPNDVHNRFRLALTDLEGLQRTADYLMGFGIPTKQFAFQRATETCRSMEAIRTRSHDGVAAITELIRWPESASEDWCKGFLAGIFDAEGCSSGGVLRIGTTDEDVLKWIMVCLDRSGFRYAVEDRGWSNGMTYVRLVGGLREKLRFFHTADPAITRKRNIEGAAVKTNAKLGVISIEALGIELPMYDITTGTGDFIANGVVSHNCFARKSHTYLDLDAGLDFNSKIVVKVNAPQLARKELAAPKWRGEHVAMGTNVDCYQRAEGRYQLMPGIISALRDTANPFSILTKGTLILRDAELLAEAAQVTDVGLNVSVGSVDEQLWRLAEPGTPSPQRRLDVCATLNDKGLGCGVLMGPVMPFLSDSPAQIAETVRRIAEAGAQHVSPIVLHLRPGVREWFRAWLSEHHPGLVPEYKKLYGAGSYAPKWYQQRVAALVVELAEQYGVGRRQRRGPRRITGRARAAASREPGDGSGRPPTAPTQLSLI